MPSLKGPCTPVRKGSAPVCLWNHGSTGLANSFCHTVTNISRLLPGILSPCLQSHVLCGFVMCLAVVSFLQSHGFPWMVLLLCHVPTPGRSLWDVAVGHRALASSGLSACRLLCLLPALLHIELCFLFISSFPFHWTLGSRWVRTFQLVLCALHSMLTWAPSGSPYQPWEALQLGMGTLHLPNPVPGMASKRPVVAAMPHPHGGSFPPLTLGLLG